MSTQLAEVERTETVRSEIVTLRVPRSEIPNSDLLDAGNPSSVVRGIINAVLIATPFWMLFGFALYLLI